MRDLLAHRLTSGPGRVYNLERDWKSQLLRVTVHDEATGCLKATGRNLHAGTRHDAAVDGVTQIHIAVTSPQRLQIAQRRETHHQVFLRVRERGQGAVLVGIAQELLFEVRSVSKNVSVRIDQAGKYGGLA